MTTSELKYPVILITKKGYIGIYVDEDILNTLNRATFRLKSIMEHDK